MNNEKPTHVRVTVQQIMEESAALTDAFCDLLPGKNKISVALMMLSMSKQIQAIAPRDWQTAKEMLGSVGELPT